MLNIVFIKTDGTSQTIAGHAGDTLMEAARRAGTAEILAECGGNCMCATCHVFAAEENLAALPPLTDDEDALLDGTATDRQPNSRLSCQIKLTDAMDGFVFHLPDTQV